MKKMNNKYYYIQILLSLLYLSNTLGHRTRREVGHESESTPNKPEIDELDRTIINQTGCKYVSLAKDESVLFTKNSGNLAHTTLAALLSDETLVNLNQTNLEMHFAIRSDSDLRVLLFTRKHYVNMSRTESDFEIAFESNRYQKSYLKYVLRTEYGGSSSYEEITANDLLSHDRYKKLYIKLDGSQLMFGEQCSRSPFHREEKFDHHQAVEFVQFGFLSKSENGAKILYDCPSNFAGCPCDWIVH